LSKILLSYELDYLFHTHPSYSLANSPLSKWHLISQEANSTLRYIDIC